MPRKPSIPRIRAEAIALLDAAEQRFLHLLSRGVDVPTERWAAAMLAVDAHASWERFAEDRLVFALAHSPKEFLTKNAVRGVSTVSVGLATVFVRGSGGFFDFRSTADLMDKADRFLTKAGNPFRSLTTHDRSYLDALAATRNLVVHRSARAELAYRRVLTELYGLTNLVEPGEFLDSIDRRPSSPVTGRPRLLAILAVAKQAIGRC